MVTLLMQGGPASSQGPTRTPAPSLEQLQLQAADLNVQLAGLRADQTALRRILTSKNWDPDARPVQLAKFAQLNVQIAQTQAQLANVQATIAVRQGGQPGGRFQNPGQFTPPLYQAPRSRVNPEMLAMMGFTLVMVFAIPMSIAFARRLWRGKPQTGVPKPDEMTPRLERIEHAVDAIAIEVERIAEGQRFVTKLMAERPSPVPMPMQMRADSARAADESALGEGKPFLALGAGPIEAIRMPERQSVRQSITPH